MSKIAVTGELNAEPVSLAALDATLGGILTEIEREKAPERLMNLALRLQGELAMHRQKHNPN